jgi:hypothetical protein
MDDLLTSSHGIVHLKSFDLIAPNMEKSALPMPLLEKSEALPANVYIRQEVKPGKGMEEKRLSASARRFFTPLPSAFM